jgi:hypothetical protein
VQRWLHPQPRLSGHRRQRDVLGATIFALEIPGWWSFDIASIVERLADYVAEPVVLTDP